MSGEFVLAGFRICGAIEKKPFRGGAFPLEPDVVGMCGMDPKATLDRARAEFALEWTQAPVLSLAIGGYVRNGAFLLVIEPPTAVAEPTPE